MTQKHKQWEQRQTREFYMKLKGFCTIKEIIYGNRLIEIYGMGENSCKIYT